MTADKVQTESQKERDLGNEAFKQADYTSAITHYKKALFHLPSGDGSMEFAAALHSNMSFSWLKLESYRSALADADSAVALRPSWVKAHARRGAALIGMGRYKEARESYLEGLRLDPGNVELLRELQRLGGGAADTWARAQPSPSTAEVASTCPAEELEESQQPVVATLAAESNEAMQGSTEKTHRTMQGSTEKTRCTMAASAPAGRCGSGQAARALAVPSGAEPLKHFSGGGGGGGTDRGHFDAGRVRGNAAFKSGDFGEAVEWYTRGITDHPQDFRLFTNRATSLLKLGNFQQACLDAGRALELNIKWSRAHLRLGQALEGLREWQAAEQALLQGCRMCPGDRSVLEEALQALRANQAQHGALVDNSRLVEATHGERMQAIGMSYEVYPAHPAVWEEAQDAENDADEAVAGFVTPVRMPDCMQGYSAQQASELATTQSTNSLSGRTLLVAPLEGLARRLEVVVNALLLAADMGRQLLLCWQPTVECMDLFEEHPGITVLDDLIIPAAVATARPVPSSSEAQEPMPCAPSGGFSWRVAAVRRPWTLGIAEVSKTGMRCAASATDGAEAYREYEDVDCLVISTSEEFYPGGGVASQGTHRRWLGACGDPGHPHRVAASQALNSLKPRLAVTRRVMRLKPFTVAVHIRGGDNINGWHSPIEIFFAAMEARINREHGLLELEVCDVAPELVAAPEAPRRTRFFLCTDDPEMEELVYSRYGVGLVSSYPKRSLDRHSKIGVEDALVDLLHLGQSEELIGSYWSSYTSIGALWRMQPMKVIYRQLDTSNKKLVAEALEARFNANLKCPR
ncbi:hypothetical protein CYMTET_5782 [Cymbomonas tetramitiformis]|uniref:Uncharacterized protein n=1 Tax=Cymbomonas tetramitiformis TaxID=36881 RepID=A0AAE0GYU7_9CHLO|nr:hypothetical protein CYMTET_5782 [Cymbomonas tetramitiformis]